MPLFIKCILISCESLFAHRIFCVNLETDTSMTDLKKDKLNDDVFQLADLEKYPELRDKN